VGERRETARQVMNDQIKQEIFQMSFRFPKVARPFFGSSW